MAWGYIFGSNNYQFVNKSHLTSYQDAFTQAGLNLSNNYQILRKPHIQGTWLHPNTSGWSNNQLLRKCDIYRQASGSFGAANYEYLTWDIAIAVMILDDEDNIMTKLKEDYRDYNTTPGIGQIINANYDYLFHYGIMYQNYNGSTINKSVKYVKYNSRDFYDGYHSSSNNFIKYFSNIVSNGVNIAEWTNPILLGVVESKAWYTDNTGQYNTAMSFDTFNNNTNHLRLYISGVGNLWNNYKVIDSSASHTSNLTQVFSYTAYSNYIYKSLDLGSSYAIGFPVN